MKNVLIPAVIAGAVLAAIAGCASVDPMRATSWRVEPVMEVKHSMASSQAYYLLGRYHDGMHAWDRAIEAYRKAIGADPNNVEAYNALGVALARRSKFDAAEAVLRNALAIDPGRAHVRSNLGYVLLLAGKSQEAVTELTAAVRLDRDDVTARNNLREATAQREPEPQARADAEVVAEATAQREPEPQARADAEVVAVVDAPTPAALHVIDQPTVPAFVTGATSGPTEIPVDPPSAIDHLDVVASASTVASPSSRLELSNGNGVRGAAARLQQWLSSQGVHANRLTNQRPYVQQQTVIQYRSGQEEAARRVESSLPVAVQLSAAPSAGLRTDVRVVLGLDWVHMAACLEQGTCQPRAPLVAAAPAAD
jgi:tetratricopeptide (TPR) repeat protein